MYLFRVVERQKDTNRSNGKIDYIMEPPPERYESIGREDRLIIYIIPWYPLYYWHYYNSLNNGEPPPLSNVLYSLVVLLVYCIGMYCCICVRGGSGGII